MPDWVHSIDVPCANLPKLLKMIGHWIASIPKLTTELPILLSNLWFSDLKVHSFQASGHVHW
jgi:hypothetical protein